ncbi:hypothetical protein MMC15_007171 [Xylographa vitiligo]|nr:hypothetical protein [Xylographa vitiligo]
MNPFSVTGADFATAMSTSTVNRSQQDLGTYGFSFPGPGNNAQIGDATGLDPLPPLDVEDARVSSQLTGREANYGYPGYMALNVLRSTISDEDTISQFAATYDSTGGPSAYTEPEEPIQAYSHSGYHEDKLRSRILELEDNKHRALLMVKRMDSELITLRKAKEILSSDTRS